MFFHGIKYQYLLYQYPILSPRLTILRQNKEQKLDRKHLVENFGFEPVHFLESSNDYSYASCIKSCYSFGDIVFGFKRLPLPILQLSENEVGVPIIDVREANYIFTYNRKIVSKINSLFPDIPIIITSKYVTEKNC